MENEVTELLRQEREKYRQFTEWQLYARVRARIMSEYGRTEIANRMYMQLDLMEHRVEFEF